MQDMPQFLNTPLALSGRAGGEGVREGKREWLAATTVTLTVMIIVIMIMSAA